MQWTAFNCDIASSYPPEIEIPVMQLIFCEDAMNQFAHRKSLGLTRFSL